MRDLRDVGACALHRGSDRSYSHVTLEAYAPRPGTQQVHRCQQPHASPNRIAATSLGGILAHILFAPFGFFARRIFIVFFLQCQFACRESVSGCLIMYNDIIMMVCFSPPPRWWSLDFNISATPSSSSSSFSSSFPSSAMSMAPELTASAAPGPERYRELRMHWSTPWPELYREFWMLWSTNIYQVEVRTDDRQTARISAR